jgi:hypothetical protein
MDKIKSELDQEGRPKRVQISKVPYTTSLKGIVFEQVKIDPNNFEPKGKCLLYAMEIAKKNPGVEIIEGSILYINTNKQWRIFNHAWNRLGMNCFDATREEVWEKAKGFDPSEVFEYHCTVSYFPESLKDQTVIEFDKVTQDITNEMIKYLNNKADDKSNR